MKHIYILFQEFDLFNNLTKFALKTEVMTTSVFEYDRDAIRVKARFFTKEESEEISTSEVRKFSVDPNLTSYDTLRSLLSRAFDLKDDIDESFRISYYCANEWLPMLSDWDLDAAVLSASDPCLQLALVKGSQRDKVTLQGNIYICWLYINRFSRKSNIFLRSPCTKLE